MIMDEEQELQSKLSLACDPINYRDSSGKEGCNPLLTEEPLCCGSCKHFKRLKWHKDIVKEGGWQLGGLCKIIQLALEGDNSCIPPDNKGLYVLQSFGCRYWKDRNKIEV